MTPNHSSFKALFTSLVVAVFLLASTLSHASEDDFDFGEDDLFARIAEVNEGELRFLQDQPDKPAHHHHNQIHITPQALQDGWVKLRQCHANLDPVPAIDIRFHPTRIRNMQIESTQNIRSATVNGHIVELLNVERGASVCLTAETQNLEADATGTNSLMLRNGPYMRRFLDGYYPMQVTLEVSWPAEQLRLVSYLPEPQGLGKVRQSGSSLYWNGLFEGRLFTELEFEPVLAN